MLKYIIIALILIVAIFILYQIYAQTHFIVREYEIESKKLSRIEKDVTVVLLTDLHNKEYGKDNEKLVAKIDKINPDFILIAGDLMVAKPGLDCEKALNLMKKLAAKYQCFYGNGNHEYRMKIYTEDYGNTYEKYKTQLQKMGVNLLENSKCSIKVNNQNINIYGLEIEREYYKRFAKIKMEDTYIEDILGKINESDYNILIAHNPKYFENYAKWGADVTVSGHLHGGLVRLPFIGGVASPQIEIFPKYSDGKYTINGKNMILSCGLGTHTINVRVNNPAELSVIKLKSISTPKNKFLIH